MKTHKVLDLTYHPDEGQICFVGTFEECCNFIFKQDTVGLEIIPLTNHEIKLHNNLV